MLSLRSPWGSALTYLAGLYVCQLLRKLGVGGRGAGDGGRGRDDTQFQKAPCARPLPLCKQVLIKQAFAGCLFCSSNKYYCGSWLLHDRVREGLAEEVMSEQEGERASGGGPVGIWGDVHGQREWCIPGGCEGD